MTTSDLTPSDQRIGIAVIGLGAGSKPHLEALDELKDQIEVVGVFNRSPARAEKVKARYGYRIYNNAQEIADDPAVDIVLLLTPPDNRLPIVEMMARAGKHILSEKPIERTLEAAENIVTICEDAGVHLGIMFQNRFRSGAIRLREVIENNELGDIALARAVIPWWRAQSYYDEPGRGTFARDGGGVLISQAIHTLDLMLSMTGPVSEVQAFLGCTSLHQMEAEDFATAGLRFANGALGSIVATTATFPGGGEEIIIDGHKGTAAFKSGKLRLDWHDGRSETVGNEGAAGGGADPMAFSCEWHQALIADFADAVRAGRDGAVTGKAALEVHRLIDAMARSSAAGEKVMVSGGEPGAK